MLLSLVCSLAMLLTIAVDVVARIVRHHFGDGWPVGVIAKALGVHRDTVKRIVATTGAPPTTAQPPHPSKLDPFVPMLLETLTKYPDLTAKRLHGMAVERGYIGGPDHFRHWIEHLRPRKPAEAFLRLRTLPGEQAQVDWAHFGTMAVQGGERKLYAFVMVLSYCRRAFVQFGFDIGMAGFVRGHCDAFAFFGGVPRVILYDNLKSAVLERIGDIVRFHPEILALSGHFRFEARPVAVARGNEKGRVERRIQDVRRAFFAGRTLRDIDTLNAEATAWTAQIARERKCPGDLTCTVEAAFAEEQPRLRKLPPHTYPAEQCVTVSVGKTPYVRFDRNDYSVPHDCVRRPLTVRADLDQVRVFEGERLVATHRRNFALHQQIEDEAHIATLRELKANASLHSAQAWLLNTVPETRPLLARLAQRQGSIGTAVAQLARLLRSYGVGEFRAAVAEVSADATACHPLSVRHVLERNRKDRDIPAPVLAPLSPHRRELETLLVIPHDLVGYDQLGTSAHHAANHGDKP